MLRYSSECFLDGVIKMELSEKEAHCLARLLQGTVLAKVFLVVVIFVNFSATRKKKKKAHLTLRRSTKNLCKNFMKKLGLVQELPGLQATH